MSQSTTPLEARTDWRTTPKSPGERVTDFVDRYLYIIFPLPALILVAGIMLYPLSYTAILSMRDYGLNLNQYKFVGAAHFVQVFQDERFISAFGRTIYFTALSVVATLVLGMIMALIMNQEFPGSGIVRTLFLLPMVATPVATSLVWMMMFNPTLGVLNFFLRAVGLPPSQWVANPNLVIPSIVMVDVWQFSPFVMLILVAGLRSLPLEPFESAMIDGASRWQVFTRITLPLLQPALAVALLFRTIDALKVFDLIYVMTAGGPGYNSETMYIYSYNEAFKYMDLGYGSAVILVFTLVVALFSLVWIRMRNRSWV